MADDGQVAVWGRESTCSGGAGGRGPGGEQQTVQHLLVGRALPAPELRAPTTNNRRYSVCVVIIA